MLARCLLSSPVTKYVRVAGLDNKGANVLPFGLTTDVSAKALAAGGGIAGVSATGASGAGAADGFESELSLFTENGEAEMVPLKLVAPMKELVEDTPVGRAPGLETVFPFDVAIAPDSLPQLAHVVAGGRSGETDAGPEVPDVAQVDVAPPGPEAPGLLGKVKADPATDPLASAEPTPKLREHVDAEIVDLLLPELNAAGSPGNVVPDEAGLTVVSLPGAPVSAVLEASGMVGPAGQLGLTGAASQPQGNGMPAPPGMNSAAPVAAPADGVSTGPVPRPNEAGGAPLLAGEAQPPLSGVRKWRSELPDELRAPVPNINSAQPTSQALTREAPIPGADVLPGNPVQITGTNAGAPDAADLLKGNGVQPAALTEATETADVAPKITASTPLPQAAAKPDAGTAHEPQLSTLGANMPKPSGPATADGSAGLAGGTGNGLTATPASTDALPLEEAGLKPQGQAGENRTGENVSARTSSDHLIPTADGKPGEQGAGSAQANAATGAADKAAAQLTAPLAAAIPASQLLGDEAEPGLKPLELSLGSDLGATVRGGDMSGAVRTESLQMPNQSQSGQVASQVAAEIARNLKNGQTRFQMRFDPPELGRVEVNMKVGSDGSVQAHLIVERPETLDMFMRDQRGLERALEAAGLKADSQNLEFSLKQDGGQQFASGDGQADHGSNGSQDLAGGDAGEGDEVPEEIIRLTLAEQRGGLDVKI